MKTYTKVTEGWDLDIESIFNREYTYFDSVRSNLSVIIMDENNISEKSFTKVDQVLSYVKSMFETNQEVISIADDFNADKKRPRYCAEKIFDEIFTADSLKIQ